MGVEQEMLADVQNRLRGLLANPGHDRELLEVLAIVDKQLYDQIAAGQPANHLY